MDVSAVDPRDIEHEWQADTYRVYFWSRDGSACEEHELSEVHDLTEVLNWVTAHGGDRVPEIFVRHDHVPERGLIRISGGRPAVD